MVIVRVHMIKGRERAKRRDLIRELTDSAVNVLGVSVDDVRVLLVEIDPDDWGIAGVPAAEARRR